VLKQIDALSNSQSNAISIVRTENLYLVTLFSIPNKRWLCAEDQRIDVDLERLPFLIEMGKKNSEGSALRLRLEQVPKDYRITPQAWFPRFLRPPALILFPFGTCPRAPFFAFFFPFFF